MRFKSAKEFKTLMRGAFDCLDKKPPYLELLFSKLQDTASIQTQKDRYQQQPVEMSKGAINGLVKSVFGPPPYHGQTRNILETFNELLLLLRREELVRAPQVITHVPLGMPYTTGMQEGDEYLANSLAAIHDQFLAEPPSWTDPDFHDAEFSKEDFLAAQTIFALVASGDILIQYPAHAVAHFRVDALQPGNPATMLCLHNKQMRRWPISPLSLICLLRLLGLIPRAERENAYFFRERFFEVKEITPGKMGRQAKSVKGGILLHQLFKRWLGIMADRCEVPKLELKQTIKAARILAQLNRPPLVVEHLRRKAPSAALDYQSWNSFMLDAPYEPDEDNRFLEFDEPDKGESTPSAESGSIELDEEAVTRAQDVLERIRAEILALPAKPTEEQRLAAARNLLSMGAELPLLGLADGERAMKGNNRAALVYLAYRLYEDQAGKETLKNEWGRCSEIVLEILAGNSLAGLSADDLAGLAGGYIRNQDPGRPQQNAAVFIRRFIRVIRKQAKSLCEPGLSVAAMNANSPELRADWVEKARRILTPGQAESLLGEAATSEERDAFLIFMALGYYCGLREGEILALKGSNYQRGLNHELHLTKSKTRNGLRTIPFDVLTPNHLRREVVDLIASRANAAPDELLVPDGASLMARFERLLFKTYRISSHMLRHSMATVLSLKLCLAYNLINPDVVHPGLESLRRQMEFLHGEQFSRESLFELCHNLLGPAWRFTRHHIVPVVSKLMGHGEPTVTLEVYLHSPDFIASFTCESGHQTFLSQKKAALLLGMDRKTLRDKADSPSENGYSLRALNQVAVSHYERNPQLRADLADWIWDF